MGRRATEPGIQRVVCNEDIWYLRIGARLGLYRKELTHSTIETSTMAVPRAEVAYWRACLEELEAGTLAHGPARAMLVHESVHSRQMFGRSFPLWGLRYLASKRFRRRIEEEAYTEHLVYLAGCGVALEAPYWIGHFRELYFGAFSETQARATFDRIAAVVRERVPDARISESVENPDAPAYAPWLRQEGAR